MMVKSLPVALISCAAAGSSGGATEVGRGPSPRAAPSCTYRLAAASHQHPAQLGRYHTHPTAATLPHPLHGLPQLDHGARDDEAAPLPLRGVHQLGKDAQAALGCFCHRAGSLRTRMSVMRTERGGGQQAGRQCGRVPPPASGRWGGGPGQRPGRPIAASPVQSALTSLTCYAGRSDGSRKQRAAASGGQRRRRRPAVGRSAGLSDGWRRAVGVESRLRGPLAGGAGGRGGGRGVGVKRSASVGLGRGTGSAPQARTRRLKGELV